MSVLTKLLPIAAAAGLAFGAAGPAAAGSPDLSESGITRVQWYDPPPRWVDPPPRWVPGHRHGWGPPPRYYRPPPPPVYYAPPPPVYYAPPPRYYRPPPPGVGLYFRF
jgi:hypothetical protein